MIPVIRNLHKDEYPLLENFLYEAIFQKDTPVPHDIVHHPSLRIYTASFGTRKGDVCLCAEVEDMVVGAVWARHIRGFGHVDDAMPELAVAVHPPFRGRGLGTALVNSMLKRLRHNGVSGVSLSVHKDNPASMLYLKLGFSIIREEKKEYIMVCHFSPKGLSRKDACHELL